MLISYIRTQTQYNTGIQRQCSKNKDAFDECMRCVLTLLVTGKVHVPKSKEAPEILLALRDTICVPRDMPIWSSRRYLEALTQIFQAGGFQEQMLSFEHIFKDLCKQNPFLFLKPNQKFRTLSTIELIERDIIGSCLPRTCSSMRSKQIASVRKASRLNIGQLQQSTKDREEMEKNVNGGEETLHQYQVQNDAENTEIREHFSHVDNHEECETYESSSSAAYMPHENKHIEAAIDSSPVVSIATIGSIATAVPTPINRDDIALSLDATDPIDIDSQKHEKLLI
jgi:hypothetical protein